jgi:hypothetical protein
MMPISCALTPEAIRAARAGLLPGLAERAERREATEDGYRLTFAAEGDILQAIAGTIDAERQCCRWLRFEMSVLPDGGPIVLTLSGPAGAREFLEALLSIQPASVGYSRSSPPNPARPGCSS